jgi:glycosyltransferase involved in cell wall biosynthesis
LIKFAFIALPAPGKESYQFENVIMTPDAPNVIFIGSFVDGAKDGSVGGQMFACKSIINSRVSDHVNFLLIDSTVDTVPVPPWYKRVHKVFPRFYLLSKFLLTRKVSKVLIFCSAGPSFIEKGLAVIVSKLFLKKVILAPVSGLIKDQVQSSSLFRAYVKFIFSLSDKVICQSNGWKSYYQEVYRRDDDKFKVILNWINLGEYISNNPVYKNKPGNARILLYLGWIEEYKGIFDLVEAINLIKDKIGDLQVHVYGSGKAEKQAVALCRKYGLDKMIIFRGRANDQMKFGALATADIYVQPSHAEGFPNALIEAMASGIPSIASNVGGIPEIIIPGETGILIEPHDIRALSAAILQLYHDNPLREILARNAREIIVQKNSLEIAENKFIELLVN